MQDEEKIIDVGEADEQEQEIDLDAPAPEQSLEEEKIDVEQVSEDSSQPADATEESTKQSDVPKGELEEYSEGVNKRIAKLTRKMREAERQKEEAIAFAKTQKQEVDNIRNKYETLDTSYTQEFEKRVTTNIEAVKNKLAQAINAGDIEAQVAAQTDLAQLTMDSTRLARLKEVQEKPVNAPSQEVQKPAAPQQPVDPRADAWASKNTWFGTDNAMTYTAFDIHKKLVEEEGFDPQTQEYYSEVDKRIRLEFPHKFGNMDQSTVVQSQAPVQNVASARRPAAKGRRKTVKLTPSQVAISKRLGVPLEEYAKQLAAKEV